MDGMPGPGHHTQSYSSFGNTKNNTHFGSGRKDSRNNNPGPGQYNEMGRNLTSNKSQSIRFGSTSRPDLWQKDTKNDLPGPGNYMDETNTFGKAAKGYANMGSKHRQDKNDNPGPGQYANESSVTKPKAGTVALSLAERKDLW